MLHKKLIGMKRYKKINTDEQTYQKIIELARKLGKTKAGLLREVMCALYDVVGEAEAVNMEILKPFTLKPHALVAFKFDFRQSVTILMSELKIAVQKTYESGKNE